MQNWDTTTMMKSRNIDLSGRGFQFAEQRSFDEHNLATLGKPNLAAAPDTAASSRLKNSDGPTQLTLGLGLQSSARLPLQPQFSQLSTLSRRLLERRH